MMISKNLRRIFAQLWVQKMMSFKICGPKIRSKIRGPKMKIIMSKNDEKFAL